MCMFVRSFVRAYACVGREDENEVKAPPPVEEEVGMRRTPLLLLVLVVKLLVLDLLSLLA